MRKRVMLAILTVVWMVSASSAGMAEEILVKEGARGDTVRQVQVLLIEQGYMDGEADGVCGGQTVEAIKKFQKARGMEADGICGAATYQALCQGRGETASEAGTAQVVKEGARGDRVRQVQEMLIAQGYMEGTADGICGSQTVEAIKKFQAAKGLEADGVCGNATYQAMSGGNDAGSPGTPSRHLVKEGQHDDMVRQVQEMLIGQGYLSGAADGFCGSQTVEAIKKFQSAQGLEPDGICGEETYLALSRAADPDMSKAEQTEIEWEFSDNTETWQMGLKGRMIYVEATAYSSQDPGLSRHTASGTMLRRGVIAVDPAFIPLGTRVLIPGYGIAVAEDIGLDIRGNRIDVAFDTHAEALAFGRQELEIYIMEEE